MKVKVIATGSTGNAYHLTDGRSSLLLEAGIPLKQLKKGLNYSLSSVDGCLVTHEHKDHALSVKSVTQQGVNIYLSDGTFKGVFKNDEKYSKHRINIIKSGKLFKIKTFNIYPFDTKHDANEPLGFIITSDISKDRLIFATDTREINVKTSDLSILLVEINYDIESMKQSVIEGRVDKAGAKRILKTHLGLDIYLKYLASIDKSKLREIHVIHTSERNSNKTKILEEIQRIVDNNVKVVIY